MRNSLLRGSVALILIILLGVVSGFICMADAAEGSSSASESKSSSAITSEAALKAPKEAKSSNGGQESNVFTLGEIEVRGTREATRYVTSDKVAEQEMREFSTDKLPDALNLLPGVTLDSGGRRNERNVYVRGFGTSRVPVFMDGIPVYVPYDRAFDYNRFSTFDLSEIIVTKGFTSVLYGPNTMGGAINMVTRRPSKKFEGNAGAGYGSGNSYYGYTNIGSNQKYWYIQGGASFMNQDYYPLSSNFTPTVNQAGSGRLQSYYQDSRVNLKIGLTPFEGHEYAFGWIAQRGEKGGPADTRDASLDSDADTARWLWPRWDKDSYYFTSMTPLGEKSYAKTRLYYDTFDNWLDYFNLDDNSYTTYYDSWGQRSYYDDYTWGGTVELGTKLIPYNNVKAAFHYKRDSHKERTTIFNTSYNSKNTRYVADAPWQHTDEATISAGLEDTIDITKKLYVIAGVSYDKVEGIRANKWTNFSISSSPKPYGTGYTGWKSMETDSVGTWNPQLGVFYKLSDTGIIHVSVEKKTRFATMKEKYSWRFGKSIENPSLKPERSINYEIGYEDVLLKRLRLKTAVFRNDIADAIESVTVTNPYYGQTGWTKATVSQSQNIGRVQQYGLELSVDASILDCLDGGVNYTYINRTNESRNNPTYVRLTGVPAHKVFTYLKYRTPLKGLSALGSFEYGSSRTASDDGYYETGTASIMNIKVMYDVIKDLTLEGGVRNVLDRNYQYSVGYPEAGRTVFAGVRYRF